MIFNSFIVNVDNDKCKNLNILKQYVSKDNQDYLT